MDFVFRLGKETYRFCRSIRVHYVRGSGRKEFREEHACWKEQNGEWELWESGSETQVRRCAEKLTGLTPEQFSQVIVLPQGDFLRLLRASSREKAEMLRTLFAMTECENSGCVAGAHKNAGKAGRKSRYRAGRAASAGTGADSRRVNGKN